VEKKEVEKNIESEKNENDEKKNTKIKNEKKMSEKNEERIEEEKRKKKEGEKQRERFGKIFSIPIRPFTRRQVKIVCSIHGYFQETIDQQHSYLKSITKNSFFF